MELCHEYESRESTPDVDTDAIDERDDISWSKDVDDIKDKTNSLLKAAGPRNIRVLQNFLLVWLDDSIDKENHGNYRNAIAKLQRLFNVVEMFTDVDECIDFITNINEEKIFLIVSETYFQTVVPMVDEIPQVSSIYIFSMEQSQDRGQEKHSQKLNGSFADISSLCEALEKSIEDCEHKSISISFVKTTDEALHQSLDTLDPSFMYTQILKEILLTIDFETQHLNEFLRYCREQFAYNDTELYKVDRIERQYSHRTPIWWYTLDSFLYIMLNRALRTMEFDLIITMGFFVRDLHNHIATLHAEQYGKGSHLKPFIVYRGQYLSQTDFNQLATTQGGLLAFNNFLSTSRSSERSWKFIERASLNPSLVGVLFILEIDPSLSVTPFADIKDVSYFHNEEEILFSMHSVFRIKQVEQIESTNNRLWQITLTLTSDHDPQLQALEENVRIESFPHKKGWYRLGNFLLKIGEFHMAEEVFETILNQTCHEREKENMYHMLGIVKFEEEDYIESITSFEKSIQIMQKILSPTHPYLASFYRNISVVYDKIGEYSKALSCQHKALNIHQNMDSFNHPTVSASNDSENLTDETSNIVAKPLSPFKMAIQTLEETLPKNDPSLIKYYDLCGSLYEKMGDNVKALLLYHQAYTIKKSHFLPNHPSFAISYANFATALEKLARPSETTTYQWTFCYAHEKCPVCEKLINPSTSPSLHQLARSR